MRIRKLDSLFISCFANHCVRTTFATTEGVEHLEVLGFDREHIALLRFVTPNFERRHLRFRTRNGSQIKATTGAAIFYQFRQRIRESAGANIVDEGDWIRVTHLPAAVDNLLTASLHFGVFTLHRGKIEIFVSGPCCHR